MRLIESKTTLLLLVDLRGFFSVVCRRITTRKKERNFSLQILFISDEDWVHIDFPIANALAMTNYLQSRSFNDRSFEFEQLVAARYAQKHKPLPTKRDRWPRNKNHVNAMNNFLAALSDSTNSIEIVHDSYKVAETSSLSAFQRAQNTDSQQVWSEIVRCIQSKYITYLKRKMFEQNQKIPAAAAIQTPMKQTNNITQIIEANNETPQYSRVAEMKKIQTKLEEISSIFLVLQAHIDRQMPLIQSLERNVDSLSIRIDASRKELEDAAPRMYHSRLRNWTYCWGNTFSSRLRFCVCSIILCNCFLFMIGVL